jgi:2-polyprenyl-3-methyl-5-hydroxy-6-metoxy-1,4-benzoquinol methylase
VTSSSTSAEYAERLQALSGKRWKRFVPNPYRWVIRRYARGRVLEVGCGIGRCLEFLHGRSLGVDPNVDAVAVAVGRGFPATTIDRFWAEGGADQRFDSVLCAHVIEHMTHTEAIDMLRPYVALLPAGGSVMLVVPQLRGHRSDETHVRLVSADDLRLLVAELGLTVTRVRSFPGPAWLGRWFIYNETIALAEVPRA